NVAASSIPAATQGESSDDIVQPSTSDGGAADAGTSDPDASLSYGANDDAATDAASVEVAMGEPDAQSEATDGPPAISVSVSPLPLIPPFSPTIHDYAVRCSSGINELALDLGASPGGSFSISGSELDAPTENQLVQVGISEDQAIVL